MNETEINEYMPSMRELGRYRSLCREISLCKKRITLSENKLQRFEDLIKLRRTPCDSEEISILKISLEKEYIYLKKRMSNAEKILRLLRKSIENIADSEIKNICDMRFIQGMSWTRISIELGGYNSADGIRKKCARWFQKHT